jgi:hypothetical protein
LKIDQEFWTFEVAGGNADVICCSWVIEFSETPIYEAEGAFVVVDHDVVGFYIAMHDTLGMAIVESLHQQ